LSLELLREVRTVIAEAVERNLASSLLFSGGLDTSLIATIASKLTPLSAFTIGFKPYDSPDVRYSQMLAGKLGIKHNVHVFDPVELRQAVPSAVRIMKTFDPVAVRSSVTIYLVLADVRASGFGEAMTGDGGDECFLGYDHLYHMPEPELKREIEDLLAVERFASNVIGDEIGRAHV
jgi:asparagine synthase (glutamine-hydrolysing)